MWGLTWLHLGACGLVLNNSHRWAWHKETMAILSHRCSQIPRGCWAPCFCFLWHVLALKLTPWWFWNLALMFTVLTQSSPSKQPFFFFSQNISNGINTQQSAWSGNQQSAPYSFQPVTQMCPVLCESSRETGTPSGRPGLIITCRKQPVRVLSFEGTDPWEIARMRFLILSKVKEAGKVKAGRREPQS